MELDLHVASTFGMLLGLSLLAGLLAEFLHLPKVTAYLCVGLLMGRSVLNLIPEAHVEAFDPILKLAMAMVLFGLGCTFSLSKIRRYALRNLGLSIGELLGTFLLVSGGLMLFRVSWDHSVLLGCLALATAPATTILVLKELRSEGPVTESAAFLVALNNFAAIIAFEIVFVSVQLIRGEADISIFNQLGFISQGILGSAVVGAAAGLTVSYCCGLLRTSRWLVLLVAATTFLLGMCESFDLPYMLTFLVMGVTVANSSEYAEEIVNEVDHLTGLACVLFFAVHGAELDVQSFFAAGLVGIVYIVTRCGGKWLGVYVGAQASRQPREIRNWLGLCLLSQAGAAIALATIMVHRDPQLGRPVQTIILGSVVVFELIGPLFARAALLRAGEIPLSQVIHHSSRSAADQLQQLSDRLASTLGRRQHRFSLPASLRIASLIRKVKGIPDSAGFDEVIAYIEHSRDNTFPVVDDTGGVVGAIRYPLLSNAMFDHSVRDLVRAEDLATPVHAVLYPDEPAERAIELFQNEVDDCLPVVSRDNSHPLLGVVRRTDVMRALIRKHRSEIT